MADKAELWRGGAETELAEVGQAEAELVGVGAGGGEAVAESELGAGRGGAVAESELAEAEVWRRWSCGVGWRRSWAAQFEVGSCCINFCK